MLDKPTVAVFKIIFLMFMDFFLSQSRVGGFKIRTVATQLTGKHQK